MAAATDGVARTPATQAMDSNSVGEGAKLSTAAALRTDSSAGAATASVSVTAGVVAAGALATAGCEGIDGFRLG